MVLRELMFFNGINVGTYNDYLKSNGVKFS